MQSCSTCEGDKSNITDTSSHTAGMKITPEQQKHLSAYIDVSVPQDFVEHVAELPAENRAAGQRETQGVGPERVSSFLSVSPQDDS